MFSTVKLCAPIPSGSTDGEAEETLEGAELVSAGDERAQGSCADADAPGDGSEKVGRPGIGLAILGTFVFPDVNAGVVPGAAVKLVVWIAPSRPLPVWFAESIEDRLAAVCGDGLGKASGIANRIGGRGTTNAKAGFDPAGGGFLVVPFAPGAFEGAVVVPVCRDELEATAAACVLA